MNYRSAATGSRIVNVLPSPARLYDEAGLPGTVLSVTAPRRYSPEGVLDDRVASLEMPDACAVCPFKDDPDGAHVCPPGNDGTPAASSATGSSLRPAEVSAGAAAE